MKKVSILALHLGYGGIEKSIVLLANILCQKYNVEIAVCYQLYDKSAFELNDKVKVKYLNDRQIIPNRTSLKKAFKSYNIIKIIKECVFSMKVLHSRRRSICNYIKDCNSDVVISTRDIFNEWLSIYGKKSSLKIGWEHNHYHDNYKYAQRIIRSAKKLDYLVLVSSSLEEFYSKKMSKYNCCCVHIPNCIENLPKRCSKLDEKRIISVGRLSHEKGYIDLLRVFRKFVVNYPDWILDIVGDGDEKDRLQEYIDKNNLNKNIILHGFKGKDYINNLLSKSSLYLMTSHTESFGIVLVEAMSYGVPCIAFDSAEGACEIINSGYNGYLIKNRNIDAMKKKVSDLVENNEERIRIGKNARKSSKKYTSDIVGNKWFSLIEESDFYE